MINLAVKVGVLIFVAMLIFGGIETIGFLHHAWAWAIAVVHSTKPTIKLPHLPKLPGKPKGGL